MNADRLPFGLYKRGPRALCPHPAKPQHLPPSARPGPAPSEPAPSPALPAPQKGEDHQHPDGASAENEDKVVRKMVLKHAAPRSTVAAAPSGRTRGASGPPPPGSHRFLQLVSSRFFAPFQKPFHCTVSDPTSFSHSLMNIRRQSGPLAPAAALSEVCAQPGLGLI